jgi:hypothetical protein
MYNYKYTTKTKKPAGVLKNYSNSKKMPLWKNSMQMYGRFILMGDFPIRGSVLEP